MSAASLPKPGREEEAVPMSPIRRRIAQRLVEAQQTAALLTTFNEIDMSRGHGPAQAAHRRRFKRNSASSWASCRFSSKAVDRRAQTRAASQRRDCANDIVYHNYYDIGIADRAAAKDWSCRCCAMPSV